jgi:arginine utilization protein RocB
MLYNMEQIKNAIKTALFNKISANNHQLAEAIAHRLKYRQLFSSGDGASFYDQNGSYKKELQTCSASINVVLDEPVTNIKTVTAKPVTFTWYVNNTPTYEDVYNSYTYTYGWEITIVYKDGSEQTYTITIQNLFDFYI